MGGIMIRFVIAAFISILTIKGAFADINVFIAPNDLNYETNSTSEINHYLDELKKNNTKVDVDKDPKIKITHDGNLLIPAYDEHGKMWNLQTITPDGQKLFIQESGGRTGGCFFVIGEVQPDLYDAHIICIAEGYATGMSIHMATGHPVALSFVANNLPKVGAVLRQKYPNAVFVYCADDDSAKQDTGLKYAQEAQAITGGIICLPDFTKIKESVA